MTSQVPVSGCCSWVTLDIESNLSSTVADSHWRGAECKLMDAFFKLPRSEELWWLNELPQWLSYKKIHLQIQEKGSIPGSRRSPGGGNGYPLQYSCLKESHGQKSLAGCSLWGHKESDMTEHTHTHNDWMKTNIIFRTWHNSFPLLIFLWPWTSAYIFWAWVLWPATGGWWKDQLSSVCTMPTTKPETLWIRKC